MWCRPYFRANVGFFEDHERFHGHQVKLKYVNFYSFTLKLGSKHTYKVYLKL